MTPYFSLPAQQRLLLAGLLFLAAMAVLALCLYRYICRGRLRSCVGDGAAFLVLLGALACLVGLFSPGRTSVPVGPPWLVVPFAALAAGAYALTGILRESARSRKRLSPVSVKEALDNLNTGILFAGADGKVTLVNHAMNRLAFVLTGSLPLTAAPLLKALAQPPEGSGVQRLEEAQHLYRFPDGSVWQFRTTPLEEPELPGYTQITAYDMTRLYEASRLLQEENEALRRSNEELRQLHLHIAEQVKEQETLELKIRIHDEIGAGLIAISGLMDGGSDEDVERQLKKLCNAVRFLGGPPARGGTLDDAAAEAAELGVRLRFDGATPSGAAASRLIALAARECVTNCVKHAGGTAVNVTVTARGKGLTAVFTNDGRVPQGPIEEGVGLSALRRSVENAGGRMHLSHEPCFTLTLDLPDEEEML